MIRLALSRQRRKLMLLTALCAVAMLVIAAGNVTNELLTRPEQRRQAIMQMHGLTQGLVLDTAVTDRAEWERLAADDPAGMILACTHAVGSGAR